MPAEAVAAVIRARRGFHSGVHVNTDTPAAQAVRADLAAALPAITKPLEEEFDEATQELATELADARAEADKADQRLQALLGEEAEETFAKKYRGLLDCWERPVTPEDAEEVYERVFKPTIEALNGGKIVFAGDQLPSKCEEPEPFVGWNLIHEAAKEDKAVQVCVGSEPFVHRFGSVAMVTDEDFILAGPGFRNIVAWSDVRGAWLQGQQPVMCPICSGDCNGTGSPKCETCGGDGSKLAHSQYFKCPECGFLAPKCERGEEEAAAIGDDADYDELLGKGWRREVAVAFLTLAPTRREQVLRELECDSLQDIRRRNLVAALAARIDALPNTTALRPLEVEETCKCGHARSDHGFGRTMHLEMACKSAGCTCNQFSAAPVEEEGSEGQWVKDSTLSDLLRNAFRCGAEWTVKRVQAHEVPGADDQREAAAKFVRGELPGMRP